MADHTTPISDAVTWNSLVKRLPGCHILQSWQWGEVKQQFGWQMQPTAWFNADGDPSAAALLLKRQPAVRGLRLPLALFYCPRGPLTHWEDETLGAQVLAALEDIARREGAISMKIDPGVASALGEPGSDDEKPLAVGIAYQRLLADRGWVYSPAQVQFRNTVLIDLLSTEDAIIARMKQKTRYNIRLAQRKGVTVRRGAESDIDLLYRMYLETSLRDGFVIRSPAYYRTLWAAFYHQGLAHFLVAEYGGEPLGGLVLFTFGKTSWYFYGMSKQGHAEKMPNYLLQWEAIRLARQLGCEQFDMWGAPENFTETDRMWGVYRFKSGFGGMVVRTPGAWDYAPRRGLYLLFTRVLPRILSVMRARRLAQEQTEAA